MVKIFIIFLPLFIQMNLFGNLKLKCFSVDIEKISNSPMSLGQKVNTTKNYLVELELSGREKATLWREFVLKISENPKIDFSQRVVNGLD